MFKKRKFTSKKKFYPKKQSKYSQNFRKAVGKYKKDENRVTYLGKKNWNLPLPPRYITKVETTNQWYITSGAGSLPLVFEVKLNSLLTPWNTTNPIPAGQVTYAANLLYPLGVPNLLNATMYGSFRVFRSDCEVMVIPEATGNDSINTCIMPAETGISTWTANSAMNRPFAKTFIQFPGAASKKITNSITVPTLVGISPQAIKDDVSSSYRGTIASDPSNLLKWYIYAWDSSGNALTGANGSTVNFSAKVTYYVEFFNLNQDNLPGFYP